MANPNLSEVMAALDQLSLGYASMQRALRAMVQTEADLARAPASGTVPTPGQVDLRISAFTAQARAQGKVFSRLRLGVANANDLHNLRELCSLRVWPSDLVIRDGDSSLAIVLVGTRTSDAARVAERVIAEFQAAFPTASTVSYTLVD